MQGDGEKNKMARHSIDDDQPASGACVSDATRWKFEQVLPCLCRVTAVTRNLESDRALLM